MKYRELVKEVQDNSGFSDKESEQALRLFVETLASRLTEDERKDFASQLPEELKSLALTETDTERFSAEDMYEIFCELQNIDRDHAKKQIMASWSALKDALTEGQLGDIRSQLPPDLESELS